MTISQTVASKLFVGVVAIAMALSLVAPAQAQTDEEMQSQIDQLMATINSLQSQLGQASDGGDTMSGGSSASVCPYTWTRSLNTGASGSDVMALQKFLNADPATMVAAAGVGSAGMETDYYGGLTAAAVSNFQVMHRDAILTPVGLVNPTGYFGPSTMAKANMLCASAPVDGGDMGDGDGDGDMEEEEEMSDLQGEGTLDVSETDLDDEETEVGEGAEDEVIAVATLGAEDGDISASRLSFFVTEEGGDNEENDPWDVFDEFSLWVDGDKISEFDASDEDEWSDDDGPIFDFRFTDLDLVIEEDEEVEILLAVSVANSVDGSDTTDAADWTFEMDEIRYFDADDVASDDDVSGDTVTIDIEEEGTDDDADLESSSADPDASTLLVDDGSSDSDEFTVFIFDIEVDEDSSDLILTDAFLDVTVNAGSGMAVDDGQRDVIADIFMTIDGNTEEGEATTNGTDNEGDTIATSSATEVEYVFEFDDVELEADTDYEVEVTVVFEGQDSKYANGATISVSAPGTTWDVEGLNSDNVLMGSDTSETHTLADVIPVISDADFNVDRNEAGDAGTISYSFTMEADGETDLDFDFGDVDAVDGSADDLRFTLTGTDIAIGSAAIAKVGGDATTNGTTGWTIADGDSADFVLDVTFTTASSADDGTYRVTIETIEGLEIDETSDGMSLTN